MHYFFQDKLFIKKNQQKCYNILNLVNVYVSVKLVFKANGTRDPFCHSFAADGASNLDSVTDNIMLKKRELK